jgi:hypothetical protein
MKRPGRGQRAQRGSEPARRAESRDPGNPRHAGAPHAADVAHAAGLPGTTTGNQPGPFPAQLFPAEPDPAQAGPAQAAQTPPLTPPVNGFRRLLQAPASRRVLAHLLLVAAYIGAGVVVTWPVAAQLSAGQLVKVPDVSSYVWALWWVAHQVVHLSDPWFTQHMAAPVGIQLGFDTLMPLPGLIMTPVTLLFGPVATFSVLTVAIPGLLCYVMYRAARLWLGQPGAIAAGAFFGLSTMVTWQNLYHLNISIGTLFLPLTLEAAVRLRRQPGLRQSVALAVVLGASVLTNQESAVVAVLLALAVLVPWLVRLAAAEPRLAKLRPAKLRPAKLRPAKLRPPKLRPADFTLADPRPAAPRPADRTLAGPKPTDPKPEDRTLAEPRPADHSPTGPAPAKPTLLSTLRPLAIGAAVAVVVASPQLVAMVRQAADGGTTIASGDITQLTQSYRDFGVGLPTLFSPSPRLGHFHLGQLAAAYQFTDKAQLAEGIPAFGVVLAALALVGLALTWRRRQSWWLALLWLAGAALALGPTLAIGTRTFIPLAARWHGVTVSELMPYTWLIRIPGLSALREADRLALLGLMGAVVLAGAAVQWLWDWLRQHTLRTVAVGAVVVIAAAGFVEAGWSATGAPRMPSAMPSVDGPIAADHSGSIVVDVPFGLRGGVGVTGFAVPPEALLLATADGHPRAISYTSWVPQPTKAGITSYPFYRLLYDAQGGARFPPGGADRVIASRSARRANIGWIIVWHRRNRGARPAIVRYLYASGFHIDYQVHAGDGGITVWRRRH